MPTYQIRPVPDQFTAAGETVWGLTCEQCDALVAAVATPADLRGLSAGAALGVWPELRETVRSHEHDCPSLPRTTRG